MGYPGHRLVGGAIGLATPGPVLGVAEGIETALAVQLRTGMPVRSAVSAGLLARLEPPAGTSLVVIWADRDRSGAGEGGGADLTRAPTPERNRGGGAPAAGADPGGCEGHLLGRRLVRSGGTSGCLSQPMSDRYTWGHAG